MRNKAFNHKQIAARIDADPRDVPLILSLLQRDRKIEQVDRGRYMFVQTRDEITGILDFNQRGMAFLVSDSLDEDIKIKEGDTLDAFHGDEVKVNVRFSRKTGKAKAFVTEVIRRAKTRFVGEVSLAGKHCFIIPNQGNIHTDFYVPQGKTKNAKDGDKVLIQFKDWPDDAKNPFAEIIEVYGPAGQNDAEMHSIVAEFGFEVNFPPEVERAAQDLPHQITEDEIKKREDFRNTLTITIDPEDAKDYDDAISFQNMEDGTYEIGIHIADVSHYVQSGSLIDQEALKRGTSVYLVDRTIPMLPEVLSNELCSLNPNQDSLCYAVIFKMNPSAKVLKYRIAKTVIHSDRRFTYEEAQERIQSGEGDHAQEVQTLNKLAHILRKNRFSAGAINFETVEFKFELDEKGKPLEVKPKHRFDAHKMIEEFMLLANRTIAKHVHEKYQNLHIPYRVHEEPAPEKLSEFVSAASGFGYTIDLTSHKSLSKSINAMVKDVDGKPEADILQPLAIRSMEKAYYTSKKTSHFGLAFQFYTHFTSPIRRYPDLILHRVLFQFIKSNKLPSENIEAVCKQSSEREQKAVNAERASIKYKQVEYLQNYLGEEFDGIISGVTEWGVYVEILENKCEGMVRIRDIKGDQYDFYADKRKIVGRRTRNEYGIGQRVLIRVKNTNIERRTIDFEFVGI